MGQSTTPKYRIEHEGGDCVPMFWKHRDKPTSDGLFMLLCAYQLSCEPGGANEHIGKSLGRSARLPKTASVVEQATGKIVAAWER
jgi:hypothetical protein